MKQTIEIEVPDGKKAVWKDGKVVFEDIKPPLPKTWKEFCKQNKIKDGEGNLKNPELVQSLVEGYKGKTALAPFEVIITSAIFLGAKELVGTIEALKYTLRMKLAEELKEKADKGEADKGDLVLALMLAITMGKE